MWIRAPLESSQTAFDPFTKDSLKGAKIYRFGDIRYLSIVSNYDRGHTSDPPDPEVLLRITLGLCVAAPVGKRVNNIILLQRIFRVVDSEDIKKGRIHVYWVNTN